MCVSLRSIFVIVLLEYFSRNNTKVFCFSIIVILKTYVCFRGQHVDSIWREGHCRNSRCTEPSPNMCQLSRSSMCRHCSPLSWWYNPACHLSAYSLFAFSLSPFITYLFTVHTFCVCKVLLINCSLSDSCLCTINCSFLSILSMFIKYTYTLHSVYVSKGTFIYSPADSCPVQSKVHFPPIQSFMFIKYPFTMFTYSRCTLYCSRFKLWPVMVLDNRCNINKTYKVVVFLFFLNYYFKYTEYCLIETTTTFND